MYHPTGATVPKSISFYGLNWMELWGFSLKWQHKCTMNTNELQFPDCQSCSANNIDRITTPVPLVEKFLQLVNKNVLSLWLHFFPSCLSFSLPFTFYKAQMQQKLPHSVVLSCLSFMSRLPSVCFCQVRYDLLTFFGSFLCAAFSLSLPNWALRECFFFSQICICLDNTKQFSPFSSIISFISTSLFFMREKKNLNTAHIWSLSHIF